MAKAKPQKIVSFPSIALYPGDRVEVSIQSSVYKLEMSMDAAAVKGELRIIRAKQIRKE